VNLDFAVVASCLNENFFAEFTDAPSYAAVGPERWALSYRTTHSPAVVDLASVDEGDQELIVTVIFDLAVQIGA